MLSRKEFFKDLLVRGIRTAQEMSGVNDEDSTAPDPADVGFDLPATEITPALLAIEAECRGFDLGGGSSDALRRRIYRELAQNRPDPETDSVR